MTPIQAALHLTEQYYLDPGIGANEVIIALTTALRSADAEIEETTALYRNTRDRLEAEVDQLKRERSHFEFLYQMTERSRLRDNEYLIQKADAAEDRATYLQERVTQLEQCARAQNNAWIQSRDADGK